MSVYNAMKSTLKSGSKTVVCLTILLHSPFADSQSFVEGTHYSIVDGATQLSTPKEVVEYFSFSCPGCYTMESHIKTMQEQLSTLNFRRVHLPFGGRKAAVSQKAFVLMELLNGTQYHQRVFDRIHLQNNVFNDQQELINFFLDLGYGELEVNQALNSFAADSLLRKMNNEARKKRISLAPTIIVNGKYQVNVKAVYSGTSLATLVEYLHGLP